MEGIPFDYDTQHRKRFVTTAKAIKSIVGGGRVLDYGCHSGAMAKLLLGMGYDVDGTDFDCELKRYGCVYESIGMNFIPAGSVPNGEYDCVVFSEVLEHIYDSPIKIITELCGYLRPGGVIVITTPNVAKLENRIKLFFGVNIYQDIFRYVYDERHRNHYREYTKKDLYALTGYAEMRVVLFKTFDNVGGRTIVRRLLQRILQTVTFFIPSFRSVNLIAVTK